METLIRLATAHAKARLSKNVEVEDATQAEDILRFALYKEVVRRRPKKKHTKPPRPAGGGDAGEDPSSDESSDDSDDEGETKRMDGTQKGKEKAPADPVWGGDSQDIEMAIDSAPADTVAAAGLREAR